MNKKTKGILGFLLVIIVIAISSYIAINGIGSNKKGSVENTSLGLDLAGGVSITYTTVKEDPKETEIKDTIYKLQERISASGYTEGEVYQEGSKRINVDIPDVSDPEKILKELGEPGSIFFADEEGQVLLTGGDIKDARPVKNTNNMDIKGTYMVELEFTKEGSVKFAKATEDNVGKRIHIVYNNKTISSPTVRQKITGTSAVIDNIGDLDEASKLATFIRIGALPLELVELRSNVVGAKMGQDAISTSMKAGTIGLIIVFLFMILVYRLPGLSASIALIFYVSILLPIISIANITLTLPGIAGIVLSIGMAVDANVIIFSRLGEELAKGRKLKTAVKNGFSKANSAIIDGNITTLIAAAVLFIMGTGTIKGFAVTLGLGVVFSMFSSLVVSKVVLNGFIQLGLTAKGLYTSNREFKLGKFVEKYRSWLILSSIAILIGLVFIPINSSNKGNPLNYDIEFAGGTSTLVTTKDKVYESIEELQADVKDLVTEATGDNTPQLNTVKGADNKGQFIIKTFTLDNEKRTALNKALIDKYGITTEDIQSSSISATIGSEMRKDAILAVIVAGIGILLYITFRFKDYKFGLSAIIALLHDVLIVLAVYAIFYIPVNNTFIAAMLTIVGYSINNTIVVFDRIRENQKVFKRGDFKNLINVSINQTLGRSINTSITTLVMVVALYILGVSAIREFAIPLIVGIISGTYSSVLLAGSLWYLFNKKDEKEIKKVSK